MGSRCLLVDIHLLYLYGSDGQQLRIVANDGLSFLSFGKEEEVAYERLGTGVGSDDVHGTQQGIVASGNVILIRANVLGIGIGVTRHASR